MGDTVSLQDHQGGLDLNGEENSHLLQINQGDVNPGSWCCDSMGPVLGALWSQPEYPAS